MEVLQAMHILDTFFFFLVSLIVPVCTSAEWNCPSDAKLFCCGTRVTFYSRSVFCSFYGFITKPLCRFQLARGPEGSKGTGQRFKSELYTRAACIALKKKMQEHGSQIALYLASDALVIISTWKQKSKGFLCFSWRCTIQRHMSAIAFVPILQLHFLANSQRWGSWGGSEKVTTKLPQQSLASAKSVRPLPVR